MDSQESGDRIPVTQERRKGKGHSSGDRNEDPHRHDTGTGSQEQDGAGTGRAARGDPYENEEDRAIFQGGARRGA
jgi:hypothetical protein